MLDVKSMYYEEILGLARENGWPDYRTEQLFKWFHSGIRDFNEMSNIPKNIREFLCGNSVLKNVKIKKKLESSIDDTVKYLYMLYDGELIESVLMKYHHGFTVCISTQVGCRMGCSFCASGLLGRSRDLSASEMLAQVETAGRDNGIRVSNVVMMGMGEPLDNYDNSVRFLKLVSDPRGLNIGLRHISLSTSGVVPGIYKLIDEKLPITLSVSLHAPNDDIRSAIMPVNRRWGVRELMTACKDYISSGGRRISFEYAMISGVNDSAECARQLAELLKGMLCHVNIIPANPVRENGYRPSNMHNIEIFRKTLEKEGITATIRRTLGADINASCGQLRRQNIEKEG